MRTELYDLSSVLNDFGILLLESIELRSMGANFQIINIIILVGFNCDEF